MDAETLEILKKFESNVSEFGKALKQASERLKSIDGISRELELIAETSGLVGKVLCNISGKFGDLLGMIDSTSRLKSKLGESELFAAYKQYLAEVTSLDKSLREYRKKLKTQLAQLEISSDTTAGRGPGLGQCCLFEDLSGLEAQAMKAYIDVADTAENHLTWQISALYDARKSVQGLWSAIRPVRDHVIQQLGYLAAHREALKIDSAKAIQDSDKRILQAISNSLQTIADGGKASMTRDVDMGSEGAGAARAMYENQFASQEDRRQKQYNIDPLGVLNSIEQMFRETIKRIEQLIGGPHEFNTSLKNFTEMGDQRVGKSYPNWTIEFALTEIHKRQRKQPNSQRPWSISEVRRWRTLFGQAYASYVFRQYIHEYSKFKDPLHSNWSSEDGKGGAASISVPVGVDVCWEVRDSVRPLFFIRIGADQAERDKAGWLFKWYPIWPV